MDLDTVLQKIGEFGLYQRRMFFSLCFVGLISAFHSMGYVFWGARPEHWCMTPETPHLSNSSREALVNISIPLEMHQEEWTRSGCQIYDLPYGNMTDADVDDLKMMNLSLLGTRECDEWQYDTSQYHSTIVTKWGLVCERRLLLSTTQSVFMAGRMVGTFTLGHIGDQFGRRITLLGSTVACLLLSVVSAITPEFYSFIVLRFLLAVAEVGQFMSAFVIVMEIVGPTWRVFTGMCFMVFWALGYLFISALAYLIRGTLPLMLALSLPSSLLLVYYWLIPETPHWLLIKGRSIEATAMVHKMAKCNQADLPEEMEIYVVKEAKSQGTMVDLFRTPFIRRTTLILFYIWMVNSLVYYGLSLNTSNLGGNDYINFAIAGAVEIPAYFLGYIMMNRLGRRIPQAVVMVIAGAVLLATIPIPKSLNILTVLLAMFGKFAITASYGMVYIYSSELYPTVVRAIGLGCCNFMSRLAGILAPFMADIDSLYPGLSLLLFGVISFSAGCLLFTLPETKDKPLPSTIEEAEKFGERVNCCGRKSEIIEVTPEMVSMMDPNTQKENESKMKQIS